MGILLKSICDVLLFEEEYVKTVAITASKRYKKFSIPKKSGGIREVFSPAKELRSFQRFILDNILIKLPIHDAAMAYRADANIRKNALPHLYNNYLLRLDFEKFFPSITFCDFQRYVEKNLLAFPKGWDDSDTELFGNLVFKNGRLTIGAVTSAALTNVLCYTLDERIYAFCKSIGVTYTRYSDDLYFSSKAPNVLLGITKDIIPIIRALDYPCAMYINKTKTLHSSRKRKRAVTGLVLTCDNKVSVGRNKKRSVRALIYQWDSLDDNQKLSLKGTLAFISDIEPSFINNLCRKFGADVVTTIMKYQHNKF